MTAKRTLLVAIACLLLIAIVSAGQRRRLGPKNRDTILDARLDPGFTSTSLNRIIFLPFVNELDHPEGAMILAENFIAGMRQNHPDITIVAPQDAKQLIQDQKLSNDYRAFMGNYRNTGVATMSFLEALPRNGQVDGILLGRILGFGVLKETTVLNTTAFGRISWSKNKAMVGMELTLLRTKDGRELWWGTHGVQGSKDENVRDLAKVVGEVFGVYFGRMPY
jgi:hypothetical protein